MNIILTHGYFLKEDPAESRIMKPYVPLGLLSISAWLSRLNIENKVLDATFSSFGEVASSIDQAKPGMIGIYSTLVTKLNVIRMIRHIRENHEMDTSRIIIGGPDARYHAENYLSLGADIIVPGEGEEAMAEIAGVLSGSGKNSLSEVAGIIFKNEDGKFVRTPERKFLDPDDIPVPAREVVDMEKYLVAWKEHHGFTSLSVNTMRGCPYSCNWCSKSIYGNTYRRRRPDVVADELKILCDQYNPGQIWFTDDVFTISREWMKKFCEELEHRNISIPYECISRSDCLDDEILDLLKRSGCRKLWIGAESGSQKVLDLMNRKTDILQTILIIEKAKARDISTGTFIMLGYPGEKKADIFKTAGYLRQAKPSEFTLTMAYPISGTKFYNDTVKNFRSPFVWETQTEREIKFRREFSDIFYRYAVRYVFNSAKAASSNGSLRKFLYSMKSAISKSMVILLR
jgi:anaerobic magnesium-protoporphyrin IX monomethyl ester cyclase